MQLGVCQPSSERRSENVVAGCTTAEGSPEAPHSPLTDGVVARFWLRKADGEACLGIRCCSCVPSCGYDDALSDYDCWVQLRGDGERAVAAEEV